MKGRTILLDQIEGRKAAALLVDGLLDDLLIEGDAPAPGTIYRARAERPIKGQGGMFMTTPDGPAFLRQIKGLATGAMLPVQVSGYAEPGKAVPVTGKLLFKSRYAIVTPDAPGRNISRAIKDEALRDELSEIAATQMTDSPFGLILRSSCATADPEDIAEDIAAMVCLAEQVTADQTDAIETLLAGDDPHARAWREWVEPAEVIANPGCLEAQGVLEEISRFLRPDIALPGGGLLYAEPTRALVAIDVNTGKDTSLSAGLKANLDCCELLPRVLRVKGLGGQIVIDMAPMPRKDRRQVEQAMRKALRRDTTETTLVGWTPLGHLELQRKRDRLPLAGLISDPDG